MKYWADQYEWGCTNTRHVWHNITTNKYHLSNEFGMFDEIGYDTMEECKIALDKYAERLG